MQEIRWAFDWSASADSGQQRGGVEGRVRVLAMKPCKEQEERVEGEQLTRQTAAIDELRGGDDEVSGRCQEKSGGGLDGAGREAMSPPPVRDGALVCLAARMAEGGREGNIPILQTWQIVLP